MNQTELFPTTPKHRSYDNYMKSSKWKTKKKKAVERAHYCCQLCGMPEKEAAGGRLHVHHNSYEQHSDEPAWHLIALCPNCHDLFTTQGKLWKNAAAIRQAVEQLEKKE